MAEAVRKPPPAASHPERIIGCDDKNRGDGDYSDVLPRDVKGKAVVRPEPERSKEGPAENLFKSLPTEIFVRILLHLTPHELAQSAACCREWYYVVSDPLLWRVLDLSSLDSKLFNPRTAVTLTARLKACRSFTLKAPSNLTQAHVTALLHFLSGSPILESLCLQSLGNLLNSHGLEHHFRMSQSRCLMHVDLSHSPVTTAAVVALMDRHRGTLRTLDLSYTAIGDGTLRAVSTAKVLHTLDISSCTSVSRTSIRNFLCKRFPGCLVTLSLRGLREVKITWLYDLLKLPTSSNLRTLNVEGCERLTLADLKELQATCEGRIIIKHDAKAEDDSVWAYRRYIEFLSTDPSLPERLVGEDGNPVSPENVAAAVAAAQAAKDKDKASSSNGGPASGQKSCPAPLGKGGGNGSSSATPSSSSSSSRKR